MSIADLPAVNATLNAIAAVLLMVGYVLVRRGEVGKHRVVMIAAFSVSTLFLVSYVLYHARAGSRSFPGQGPVRVVYFVILLSHIVLAAAIVPMALLTLSYGLRARFDRHMAIARWTLPVWLYVSVTGVIVYLMLYQLY